MSQNRPFHDPLAGPIGGPPPGLPPLGAPVDGLVGQPSPPRQEPPRHEPSRHEPDPPPPPPVGQEPPHPFIPQGHPQPVTPQPEPFRFATGAPPPGRPVGAAPGNRPVLAVVAVVAVLVLVGLGVVAGVVSSGAGGGDSVAEPDPITAADLYAHDEWRASINGNEAHAYKVDAWDHADCSDIGDAEVAAIVDGGGCEFGVEAAYERTDLGLTVVQRVFVLRDADAAESAADAILSAQLAGTVNFRQELPEGVAEGQVGAGGRYLVVTFAVVTDGDDTGVGEAARVYRYLHADIVTTLIWK